MIWNVEYPQNNLNANTIHTILQNTKVLVRERFEAYNGSIEMHNLADSDDSGLHKASLTGFCGEVVDYTDLPTDELVEGSLWYVSGIGKGLYYIENGTYKPFGAIMHSAFSYAYKDDDDTILNPHTQYILKDGGAVSAEMEFETLNVTQVNTAPFEVLTKEDHENLKFLEAHESESIKDRHLATDVAFGLSVLPITTLEGAPTITLPSGNYLISFPMSKNANFASISIGVSKDSISSLGSTELQVHLLGGALV